MNTVDEYFWGLRECFYYLDISILIRDNRYLALSRLGFETGTFECLGSISRQWRSYFIRYAQSHLSNIIISVDKIIIITSMINNNNHSDCSINKWSINEYYWWILSMNIPQWIYCIKDIVIIAHGSVWRSVYATDIYMLLLWIRLRFAPWSMIDLAFDTNNESHLLLLLWIRLSLISILESLSLKLILFDRSIIFLFALYYLL